jgi:hypothetical protein
MFNYRNKEEHFKLQFLLFGPFGDDTKFRIHIPCSNFIRFWRLFTSVREHKIMLVRYHCLCNRVRATWRLLVYRQSVRLGVKPLETHDQYFFFSTEHLRLKSLCNITLWREDASVMYNCCWPSPAQSFSGPSPAGLMTIFYCFRLETPPTWRARSPYIPQEHGAPVIPSGTGFLLRLAGLRWRYSNPPPSVRIASFNDTPRVSAKQKITCIVLNFNCSHIRRISLKAKVTISSIMQARQKCEWCDTNRLEWDCKLDVPTQWPVFLQQDCKKTLMEFQNKIVSWNSCGLRWLASVSIGSHSTFLSNAPTFTTRDKDHFCCLLPWKFLVAGVMFSS